MTTNNSSVQAVLDELARDPLRNIVLLKHLTAYPERISIHRAFGHAGAATLVVLDAAVSPYDRQLYPNAACVALITSDHPQLTASLMGHVPRGAGVVFKLASEADLAPVAAHFAVTRRTAIVSFTSGGAAARAAGVRTTTEPGDATFALFATQGHERTWIEPMLRDGKAFACVLAPDGVPLAACFAFENFRSVWEVGGVVTALAHRRQGLGARVVSTMLAELNDRGFAPRYQAEEHNTASIALAGSVGLVPFLTITHYAHAC